MMNYHIQPITIERTAHVYTAGQERNKAEWVWLCLHGYAHTPEAMIPVWNDLAFEDALLFPEGLSKWYRKGFDGDVVASWMTSKHRQDEINDHCTYLTKVYTQYQLEKSPRLILFGFSQGAATAIRWLDQSKVLVQALIIYAGWPPEDVDYNQPHWRNIPIYFILGEQDPFYIADRRAALAAHPLMQLDNVEFIPFDGGHHLHSEILKQLRDKLRERGSKT